MITLLPELAVHHVTIFITAVVGFTAHHVDFVLNDFAHDFRSGHGLIAVVEHKVWDEHSISVHIGDRTGCKVAAAPCNVHDHELTVRLSIRQNAVEIPQFIGREQQTFTHIGLPHILCPPCCIVNAGFHIGVVGIIKTNAIVIIEVAVSVLIHRRNHPESVLRVVCILVLDAPQRVKHVPSCADHQLQCALLFAVFQLVQIGIVLVVQTLNIQAFLQVLNQVIAVQNAALADFNSTGQRAADGTTGQGGEALLSVQVNAFIFCALVHKLNVREDFAPVVGHGVCDDGQHFTVEAVSQLVGMPAHNRCNVRTVAH